MNARATVLDTRAGRASIAPFAKVSVLPAQTGRFDLRVALPQAGDHRIALTVIDESGRSAFRGTSTLRAGLLDDASYGYRLDDSAGLAAWWCESGWKVGRDRAAPAPTRAKDRKADPGRRGPRTNTRQCKSSCVRTARRPCWKPARVSLRDDRGTPRFPRAPFRRGGLRPRDPADRRHVRPRLVSRSVAAAADALALAARGTNRSGSPFTSRRRPRPDDYRGNIELEPRSAH